MHISPLPPPPPPHSTCFDLILALIDFAERSVGRTKPLTDNEAADRQRIGSVDRVGPLDLPLEPLVIRASAPATACVWNVRVEILVYSGSDEGGASGGNVPNG
jgi:hypothetical protein